MVSSWLLFLFLPEAYEELSSIFIMKTWWGSWRKSPQKIWGPTSVFPGSFSFSHLSALNCQQGINIIFYVFLHVYVVPGKQILGFISLCLTLRFHGGGLSCNLNSLMEPRKVIDFSFLQLLLVLRIRITIFKLFTSQSWSWSHLMYWFS